MKDIVYAKVNYWEYQKITSLKYWPEQICNQKDIYLKTFIWLHLLSILLYFLWTTRYIRLKIRMEVMTCLELSDFLFSGRKTRQNRSYLFFFFFCPNRSTTIQKYSSVSVQSILFCTLILIWNIIENYTMNNNLYAKWLQCTR